MVGERLGHSLSVPIHQAVYQKMGLPGAYRLMEVPREKAGKIAEAMRLFSFRGLNVTIPYKETVMPLMDEITPFAKMVGAVNTIENTGDRLTGHNTDVYGLIAMLERFSLGPVSGPCAVLGSGGAAKAAVAALAQMGAKEIYVVTRDKQKIKAPIGPARLVSYEELDEITGDVLINATPVGMYPNGGGCPVGESVISRFRRAADTVYNPGQTVFFKTARRLNKPACTGLYMLVCQAVRAEELWWNIQIPKNVPEDIYQALAKEFES